MTLDETLIDLIVKRAPDLRKAGVLHLTVGEISVVLAEHEAPPAEDDEKTEPEPADPLDDPATYGGRPVPKLHDDDPEPTEPTAPD